MGGIVYAGVDYQRILENAEREADVIIWDGGNNDFPFIKPDLWITVADPHRAGHEISYYPGEVNFRSADVIVINKVNTAKREDVDKIIENAKKLNPSAKIIEAISEIKVDNPQMINGKRVLVIEDGPTVTHGEMNYGAGYFAAIENNAKEIVDPRPFAVGSIVETFKKYPHLSKVLPAMGYGKEQIKELEETINGCDADIVVSGTPIDLNRILNVNKPIVRVRYGVGRETEREIEEIVEGFLEKVKINLS